MKYQLQQNLGLDDARHCNDKLGTSLTLDKESLAAGATVNLSESAYEYLTQAKGYVSLLAPIKATGEAKKPEITAPAK